MSQVINDLDHITNVVTGFESYLEGRTEQVDYAKSALRLNGVDLPDVAGNEGIGEAIVNGSKKMIEMVMAMLKRIKDFFFGMFGNKKAEASKKSTDTIKSNIAEIKKADTSEVKQEKIDSAAKKVAAVKPKVETMHLKVTRFAELAKEEKAYFTQNDMNAMKAAGYDNGPLNELPSKRVNLAGEFRKLEVILERVGKAGSRLSTLAAKADGKDVSVEAVVDSLEDFKEITTAIDKARTTSQSNLAHVTTITEKTASFIKSKVGNDKDLDRVGARYLAGLTKYANLYSRIIVILDNLNYDCMWASGEATATLTNEPRTEEQKKFLELVHSDKDVNW